MFYSKIIALKKSKKYVDTFQQIEEEYWKKLQGPSKKKTPRQKYSQNSKNSLNRSINVKIVS